MKSIELLLEPIRHSPLLPVVIERLQAQIAAEQCRREQFYLDMTPDQKVEFIDGEVVLHSPARNRHLEVTMMIAKLVDTYAALHQLGVVRVEKCLCTFPRNDYEPDIVFFGKAKAATLTSETLKFPIPDFVVEILSESTRQNDRGVKFEDYAANEVIEYWIVDADNSTVEQYLLRDGLYELRVKSSTGTLTSQVLSGLTIDVESMFNQQSNLTAMRELLSK
ncbi:MAG: Uma2 family endonuclease [Planctomycetales bacterium]|nr:Uma2 family endonuclease [Planctomycetales bacterium]